MKISKNQVFQNSNKILDAKLRINRRAGKENIQHKPVIVPSDLAKIRASPFLSLVLHSCKVRTEWSTATASFPSGFLTPVIFRATSRCFSAYRAALMTKSDLIFCGILFQICWLRSFDSAFKAIVSSRTSDARFKFDSGVILWTNHNSLLSIATNQFASFCIDNRLRQKLFSCLSELGNLK